MKKIFTYRDSFKNKLLDETEEMYCDRLIEELNRAIAKDCLLYTSDAADE